MMQKGKIRNPWLVILLTIITGGIYFIYWLIINPVEIKNAFQFEKGENQLKYIFTLMIIGVVLTIVFVVFTIIKSILFQLDGIFLYSSIYSFAMVFVGGFFFYNLCSATALAQKKAGIVPFEIITVFGVYLLNLLIEAGTDLKILSSKFFKNLPNSQEEAEALKHNLTDILPVMNLSGILNLLSLLLFFFFIYLFQKQVNRIWEEGKFDTPTE